MRFDKTKINILVVFATTIIVCCLSCQNKKKNETTQIESLGLSNVITGDTLQRYLISADSILLISHLEPTNAPPDLQTGRSQSGAKLLENGKISESLLKSSKKLSKTDIIQLGNILDEHVVDDIEYTKCFSPRHAIIAYNNGKISYVDVCFSCLGLAIVGFPADIEMSEKKYLKLKLFFAIHGM